MNLERLIRGGTVVTATGEQRADVGVRQGKVVAVAPDLTGQADGATELIDAGGALVLPGAVDPHVHLALPLAGTRSADDFASGTAAAALGGTTCVIDFITPERGEPLAAATARRAAEAQGRCAVDWGLHPTITDWRESLPAEIAGAVAAGYPTFKVYLAYKPTIGIDDGVFFRALQSVAAAGGRVLVHAVNGDVQQSLTDELARRGLLAPRFHPLTQPRGAEAEATARAIRLAALAEPASGPLAVSPSGRRQRGGLPLLYVVHVSCAEALDEARRLRRAGLTVALETCPQYLLHDEALYEGPAEQAARHVLSPPLRGAADRLALWQALAAGEIDVVATDHCPFPFAGGKDRGLDDFRRIPNGLPGIEERVDLLHHHGVVAGRISRARWVELLCAGPARQMGLAPAKGDIAVGADADLVVYDPTAQRTLTASDRPRGFETLPGEGSLVTGRAVHVFVRGQQVVRHGRLVEGPPPGRPVARSFPPG